MQRSEHEGAAEQGTEVEGVYSYLDNMGISMRGPEVKSRLDQHEYVWIKEWSKHDTNCTERMQYKVSWCLEVGCSLYKNNNMVHVFSIIL